MSDHPTAELITSADKAPRLLMQSGVWKATCYYRINTADELRAATANGLPKYLNPYPNASVLPIPQPQVPLWVTEIEVYFSHGTDDPVTGLNGWCEARIGYEQSAVAAPPELGSVYTEVECTSSSVHVTEGIPQDGDEPPPFANGKGASKDVGGVLVHVVTIMGPEQFAGAMQRLIQLQSGQKYNNAALVVPPLQGTRTPMTIPKGWAQYHAFKTEWVGGIGAFLRLTQTLKVAEDGYLVKWRQTDELGNPVSSVMSTPIYELADLSGLW